MKVSRGSTIANVDDCVKMLAEQKHITQTEAQEMFNDVVSVLVDAIAQGGVSIRDSFTIRKSIRQGRKGLLGESEFVSRDKYVLKIKAGKKLSEMMN